MSSTPKWLPNCEAEIQMKKLIYDGSINVEQGKNLVNIIVGKAKLDPDYVLFQGHSKDTIKRLLNDCLTYCANNPLPKNSSAGMKRQGSFGNTGMKHFLSVLKLLLNSSFN